MLSVELYTDLVVCMKISPHFDRDEFACKCGCRFDSVDVELIGMLEKIREKYNSPITINSGCRCLKHNIAIGGSENSQHITGKAADFVVQGVEPALVANFIIKYNPLKYGVGIYNTWVHVDSRSQPARWDKRT